MSAAVVRRLEAELGNRGLLLTADALAAAEAEAAQRGTELLTGVIHQCYPAGRHEDGPLALEFGSERTAARIGAALAFGAVTARVLAPGTPAGSVELLCAMFNLGIGLVDGVCDEDAAAGEALLALVQGQDLATTAAEPRERGWLRETLPPVLAEDPAVAFTVEIIEAFFEVLHAAYSGAASMQLRRDVGTQLTAALEAERRTVMRSTAGSPRDELIECSRLTSVLPFEIIQTLARGGLPIDDPSAGTQLGEAMWRIDDLVDLCADARSGSLNAVLLSAARPGERDLLAALEALLASTGIASAAADAAESLQAGLQHAGRPDEQPQFLQFIQRYAGIAPRRAS